MALNNMGLGFVLSAQDLASAVFARTRSNMQALQRESAVADDAVSALAGRAQDLAKGPKGPKKPFGLDLEEMRDDLKEAGTKLLGFGAAGLAGLGYAANAAASFGNSVAEVASITDRAAFPIALIEQIGKDMASTYGGDLERQVKALYQAVSSGATTAADATALLHASNKLAVGGLADSFQAVDALTNVVNAFGMSLDTTADIADAMFVAVKVGKTDVSQLASSIGDLAPIAALAGLEMDEMFAAVAAASNQLGSGTKAITGLRAALSDVLKPTSDAVEEAKRLGIQFTRERLGAVGIQRFVQEITEATGYTADSLPKLFGSIEGLGAVAALAANEGRAMADATKAMSERAGSADAAFRTMADAAAFAKKQIGANFQTALVNVGQVVLPVVEALARGVNRVLLAFNRAPAFVRGVIVALFGGAAGAIALTGAFLLLSGAILGIAVVAKTAAVVFGVVLAALPLVVAAVGALTSGFLALRLAVDQNLGGLGRFFGEGYQRFKLFYQAITELFSQGGFSEAVSKELGRAENQGVERFATNVYLWFNRIKAFFGGLVEGFQQGVAAAEPVFKAFRVALEGVARAFGFLSEAAGARENQTMWLAMGAAGQKLGQILAKVATLVVSGFTIVAEVARGFSTRLSGMGRVATIVWQAFGALGTALGNLVGAFGSGGAGGAAEGFGKLLANVVEGTGMLLAVTTTLAAGLVNAFSGSLGGMIGALSALWNGLTAFLAFFVGVFTGDWALAWHALKDVVASVVKVVVNLLAGLLSAVGGFVDSLASAFGADLGVKGAIEGGAKDMMRDLDKALGLDAGPGGGARPVPITTSAPAPTAAAAPLPAVAAVGAAGAATAAALPMTSAVGYSPAPPPPVNMTSTITLQVDGEKLASVVAKQNSSDGARAFGPTPTAT